MDAAPPSSLSDRENTDPLPPVKGEAEKVAGNPLSHAAPDERRYGFTFGAFNQVTAWTDVRQLSWEDASRLLTTHRPGAKEGECIVPATFRGTRRHKADADRIDVLFLDSDAGASLEQIQTSLASRGWRAVISSTHSHLNTTTTVKRGGWDKFRSAHEDQDSAAEDYLTEEKGYLPSVADGARIIAETDDQVTFEHQPCPRFRIALPLERPWLANSYPSQAPANAAWKERVEAVAAALNLRHDQSCTDTSRLFYLPRHPQDGPPPVTAIIEGEHCDIFALPPAPKPSRRSTSDTRRRADDASDRPPVRAQPQPAPIVYVDPQTGQRLDLREWDRYHARRFELVKALQARKPDAFTGKVSENKHHLRCINADAHTSAGDDQATFVMNASQSERGWFVHHCRHSHCEGRHRLVVLQQMLEAGWLSIGDLTDPAFLSEAAAGEGASFDLTEHCVAVAFSRRFRERYRYCHTTGAWFIWTGTLWERDYRKRALTEARRLTAELNRDAPFKTRAITGRYSFAAAVERYAQADPALAVTSDIWNSDPWLLGTPNGAIDLRTGRLRRAERTDFITRSTAVVPAEVAHCPTWLQFLREATGGDDGLIRFLQQWFGYCLTGHTYEHALVFLYGPGGNGKGVLLGTIASVMGSYAATAALDTFTATRGERHPTDLAMLDGARLVQTNETEEDRAWAEARVKTLTGGDAVTARYMRQDFFTYLPQFKLVISGNHQPALRNVDDAARRRFNVVPFLFKPPNPDPLLGQKLRNEWPAILRWMIDGGLDWQRCGLVRPQVILDATEQYFAEQDLFSQWLEECCEARDGVGERISDLFACWRAFAQARSDEPHNAKWLSMALERRGFERAKDCALFRGRGFRGVQLTASMRARHWPGGNG